MAHRLGASQRAIQLDGEARAIILHNRQFLLQIDPLGIRAGTARGRGLELIEGGSKALECGIEARREGH
jgi:hypothetical protein